MKIIILLIFSFFMFNSLFSGLIITRSEMGIVSQELYHDNMFAEIHDDHIVSIWDFNTFELTLIHHLLRIYTTVDFETFKQYAQRQNQAEINSELRNFDEERRKLMAEATMTLFNRLRPNFAVVDTLSIFGFTTHEFNVFNGDIIAQKVWISRALQEKINEIVNPLNIRQVELIFKENRENYFEALGIQLDPISRLVEALEDSGYVVQRVDYGIRMTHDPEHEAEVESHINTITDIVEMNIDPAIFTYHQRFRRLDYNAYQMAVIRHMESQL